MILSFGSRIQIPTSRSSFLQLFLSDCASLEDFRRVGAMSAAAVQVEEWADEIYEALGKGEPSFSIAEVRCREPGCPPVEVIMTDLNVKGPKVGNGVYKVFKEMAEVTRADVEEALKGMASSEHGGGHGGGATHGGGHGDGGHAGGTDCCAEGHGDGHGEGHGDGHAAAGGAGHGAGHDAGSTGHGDGHA